MLVGMRRWGWAGKEGKGCNGIVEIGVLQGRCLCCSLHSLHDSSQAAAIVVKRHAWTPTPSFVSP